MVESVRPAAAGRWVGKARPPALLDRKSVASAAPVCGEIPTAEIDVSALVRPTFIMSS